MTVVTFLFYITCAWCRKLTSSFSLVLDTSASKSFPFWVIPVSLRLNNRQQDNNNSKALSNQIQMHSRPLSLTALAWLIRRHSEKVLAQYVLPPHPPGNYIPIYAGGNRFLHMHECHSEVLLRWECSFIPRPFPSLAFDCLQYANTEGEAWEIWSHAISSGRQRVVTWGAVFNRNNSYFASTCLWHPEKQRHWCYLANALASSPWIDGHHNKGFWNASSPLHVYLHLPDITAHDNLS